MKNNGPRVHINPRLKGLGTSATVAINERSNALRAEGRDVFKLGLGESPFPVPDPVVRALQEAAGEKSYLPVRGLQRLRETVAEHHSREFGIERHPDDVLIGPGSKELMFILQLSYYGDLLIPSPSWVSYAPQARIVGRDIHWIPTELDTRWRVTPEALDAHSSKARRHRLMIVNYPSNPTGCSYSRDDLRALAESARRNRIVLLSDEIYGKLHHDGAHESVVPMYPEGTIFSSGLSKWCGAGGWRLGIFVFPPELRWLLTAMSAVASETYTSTCNPVQHAAVTAFQDNPEIESYLADERRVLKSLGAELAKRLSDAGARVCAPDGGFYLFPDFAPFADSLRARGIETASEMCERILADTGVAILPGRDFGREDSEFTARLAYVDFDGGAALRGLRTIPAGEIPGPDFLREHCGRMLEAVDRLCDWITSPRGSA